MVAYTANLYYWFLELLKGGAGGDLSDKQSDCLEIVLKEARGLKVLIEDLLDLSGIRAGQITLNKETIMLKETIERHLLILCAHCGNKGLNLILDDIPEHVEFQLMFLIQTIMINLISNAKIYG